MFLVQRVAWQSPVAICSQPT